MHDAQKEGAPLAPGKHPGFGRLKSKPGIYRAKLWPQPNKARAEFADYRGTMPFEGGRKASVLLWCHADGSLGLRIELNPPEKGKAT
jgi:hypothetical protein